MSEYEVENDMNELAKLFVWMMCDSREESNGDAPNDLSQFPKMDCMTSMV